MSDLHKRLEAKRAERCRVVVERLVAWSTRWPRNITDRVSEEKQFTKELIAVENAAFEALACNPPAKVKTVKPPAK